MLRWAFRANFTNCSRFAKQEISFHDMVVEMARNEMKSVTHVHAQSVTHLPARCRSRFWEKVNFSVHFLYFF
jgi:glycine cleavage system regulatory protein